MKPFAESCIQNREPIFAAIQPLLADKKSLLEVGSGTGQHAVYFTPEFAELEWQTSDFANAHAGIQAWLDDANEPRIKSPVQLEACEKAHWQALDASYDVVYTANSLHIMGKDDVQCFFSNVATVMQDDALLIIYGPFNYNGEYSSESNARFDDWLKARDPKSCIKDIGWLNELANAVGLTHIDDIEMPANNRLQVWKKSAA